MTLLFVAGAATADFLGQAVAILGACLVLLAYALQRFNRISAGSALYLTFNFIGGALLCWAAINTGQIGFILLEGAWALISLLGLWRIWRKEQG
jgi:hypothetical protein